MLIYALNVEKPTKKMEILREGSEFQLFAPFHRKLYRNFTHFELSSSRGIVAE